MNLRNILKFSAPLLLLLASVTSFAQSNSLKSPNISGNALFLYRNSNFSKADESTERNGLDLQEAELAFYSDVDPYSRLNMLITVHPEYELNTTTNKVEEKWVFEPEELYAESNYIQNLTLRLGKFKAAFGKHNQLHDHAFPLVDSPIANKALLGDEGLNDMGLSAAYLLPFHWYSELTGQYLRGEGENDEFNSPTPGDEVMLGHWKNLFDINDDLTFEAGASYATGKNSFNGRTNLAGADITFKWRPANGGKYHSWILGGEYIHRDENDPKTMTEHGSGWNIWGQYQFAERWAAVTRYEQLKISNSLDVTELPNDHTQKVSLGIVFNTSEFSSYKAEYNFVDGPPGPDHSKQERKIYLQANYTIGSHPAHSY